MALRFSHEEKVDMIETYFKENRNAEDALRTYENKFPERVQPSQRLFRSLVINLLNHGSFNQPRPEKYNLDNEERDNRVLEYVQENPKTSTRIAQREVDVPKTTILRILNKNNYYPYKPTIVQTLVPEDVNRRMTFCEWYIEKCQEDPGFHTKVLWTDETRFTNNGVYNKHNTHFWSTHNPHMTEERRAQRRFGLNVWCGVKGRYKN